MAVQFFPLSELSQNFFGTDTADNSFYYTVPIVGALEGIFNRFGYTAGGEAAFTQWQAAGQINPAFYKRRADHLRPGEQVRLVAINRASGYTGTLVTELKAAGTTDNPTEISFAIEDLILRPPNLKIWARRISRVEAGITQGEQRDQLIGNEGAGLSDDTYIGIYSEWLDADGRPLPTGLDEFGFTGRIAQVVAPNVLAPAGSGSNLSQFSIGPGQHLQVIRLPEAQVGNQHLYVQVVGEPSNRNPNFRPPDLGDFDLTQVQKIRGNLAW